MTDAWNSIAPRTRARLQAEGVHDLPGLRTWLAKHPEGTDRIGRVMLAELRDVLAQASS